MAAQLAAVTTLLMGSTACLEHFAGLDTTVRYDPFEQVFHVERRFRNVDPGFFGCAAVEDCSAAIGRAVALTPDAFSTALSDRLLQRLLESGATDVSLELTRAGDGLDASVRYQAPVGSAAAEDTMVHAEWDGKSGRYYLVVDADAALEPLDVKARVRKQAVSGPEGTDWRESWVLSSRQLDVTTRMTVDASIKPLFGAVTGLSEQLAARGWLDAAHRASPAVAAAQPLDNSEAPAAAPPAAAPAAEPPAAEPLAAAPPAAPVAAPAVAAAPSRSWPAPDPLSPAKTYSYDARVTGALPIAAANLSVAPILPRVRVCYQEAVQRDATIAGSAFLSALVRGDGSLASTSVYGSLTDRALLGCLELAITDWTFAPWGGDGVSDVAIPLVFRVEAPPTSSRKRR